MSNQCNRTSCRYSDSAPADLRLESALRGAKVVLVIVTANLLRSKHCLQQLHWACDEQQRRRKQMQDGQHHTGAFSLLPVFYHDMDPAIGVGVNSYRASTLHEQLGKHHATASTAERALWLEALLHLPQLVGIRQDLTDRCGIYKISNVQRFVLNHCDDPHVLAPNDIRCSWFPTWKHPVKETYLLTRFRW